MMPRVAIIGSGPSGFFTAEALLRSTLGPRVHMYDRLPTPFGLVRSGVAPDHASIKSVSRVFDAIARDKSFEFFGNTEVGRDISLDMLRQNYSAVVLAIGAAEDIRLGIPGQDLRQVFSAAKFVGWYNGHPDCADLRPDLGVEAAAIFGHGNVAIDLARILLSDPQKLRNTDIAEHALKALQASTIRTVHLVGRRGPLQASFTTAELRELLLKMEGVEVVFDPAALNFASDDLHELSKPANVVMKRNLDVMRTAMSNSSQSGAPKRLLISFCESPRKIIGHTTAEAVSLTKNLLVAGPQGKRAIATDKTREIGAGLVLTSIGFKGRGLEGAPFDHETGRIPNQNGRASPGSPTTAPLYVTGWIKRGASGVIGSNRADAAETVASMLEDHAHNKWGDRGADPDSKWILSARSTSFADWQRIDDAEISAGAAVSRPRLKLVSIAAMLDAASVDADV